MGRILGSVQYDLVNRAVRKGDAGGGEKSFGSNVTVLREEETSQRNEGEYEEGDQSRTKG